MVSVFVRSMVDLCSNLLLVVGCFPLAWFLFYLEDCLYVCRWTLHYIHFFFLPAEALSRLDMVIRNPSAQHSDNMMAYDNAVSALGKICQFHRDSIDAPQVKFILLPHITFFRYLRHKNTISVESLFCDCLHIYTIQSLLDFDFCDECVRS